MAYHWIVDKDFLSRMRSTCSDVVNQLVQEINSEGLLVVRQQLVGSGAKNLIVQNAQQPIDLDYNLELLKCVDFSPSDCGEIKDYVQEVFDFILHRAGWPSSMDSTSVLTTKQYRFKDGNQTPFTIDLCITRCDERGKYLRLIHRKTGIAAQDTYFWNETPDAKDYPDKVKWLKTNNHWPELRETYLGKKNMYLRRNDHDHHSFQIYIEAVNEVYAKYNGRGGGNGDGGIPPLLCTRAANSSDYITPTVLFRTHGF